MRLALPLLLFAMAAPAAAQGPAEIQARLRAHDYERARAMALVHPWDLTSEAGDPATHRFVRAARTVEPTAYQVIQARMRAHLAARELEAARGVVLRGGVTDNGSGVIDDADRILDHFLVATHAVARRLARRQPAAAAEVCRLLLRDPPAYSLNEEPWTSHRPRDLAACARFLGTSPVRGDREAALQALRDQGQAESAAGNLALADALYELGDRDAAGAAYRAYLDAGPRRPVSRAASRAR